MNDKTIKYLFFDYGIFCRTFSHPTEEKIFNFLRLEKGWGYGEGETFSDQAIKEALELHREIVFAGHSRTNGFPGYGGELQVTVYEGEDYFAFERSPNGGWTFIQERNNKELKYIEDLTFEQAVKEVRELRLQLWNAFASYPNTIIGTPREISLTTSPSLPIRTTGEYPSLTENAA
jgi:hypothetical protein